MPPLCAPSPSALPPPCRLSAPRHPRRVVPASARDDDHLSRRRLPERSLVKSRGVQPSLSTPLKTLDPSSLLPSQAVGMVASAQANFMRVVVSEPPSAAGEELLCVVRALLKKLRRRVLVGDQVLVGSVDWGGGRGMIEEAFERETELSEPPIANVDHLLVVFSLEQPRIEPFALTRFLVEAESTGIPVALAVNKTDVAPTEMISSWEERLNSWGYQPIFCSVEMGFGLTCLVDALKGKTTVLVGPSGVGKSSIINAVRGYSHNFDGEVPSLQNHNKDNKWCEYQTIGAVSERSGKGKHTTRHVSLLPLAGGGYLADTPGFNLPSLSKVTKKSLAEAFPEIRDTLSTTEPFRCSFRNCLHLGEPGCLVKNDWERYPFYLKLLDEVKLREETELRTQGTKRESDVRYKTGKHGVKLTEPRLDAKKYRRVSRKKLNQSLLDDTD